MYVNQLDKSNQKVIVNEILKRLKDLGYEGEELKQLLNDALCSKVEDLEI